MIHPPDVISKYAPDCVIGMIGTRTAVAATDVVSGVGQKSKLVTKDVGDKIANHAAWGDDNGHNWRIEAMDDNPGVLLIPVWAYIMAAWALVKAILWEVCARSSQQRTSKSPATGLASPAAPSFSCSSL